MHLNLLGLALRSVDVGVTLGEVSGVGVSIVGVSASSTTGASTISGISLCSSHLMRIRWSTRPGGSLVHLMRLFGWFYSDSSLARTSASFAKVLNGSSLSVSS